ncbi:MAG: DNA methyltransferase [Promethearchaeota archaeon]
MENKWKERLQNLLRKLFQFESEDLDFGIYRIMNQKRDAIEKFIQKDLIEAIDKEYKNLNAKNKQELEKEINEIEMEIKNNLGDEVFLTGKEINPKFKEFPIIKKYQEKVKQLEKQEIKEQEITEVFSHIYNFFARYYDNGDFISKRRYGKNEKYVIPYNGEEVLLHWANKDQYYVKTTEWFTKYSFKNNNLKINFRIVKAEDEIGNVKSQEKKFFLLNEEILSLQKNELEIFFEYRTLTDREVKKYGKKAKQEAISEEIIDLIMEKLSQIKSTKIALNRQTLEKHLLNYIKRNTSDYFIHKNLKAFLERELDYYLKNEVIEINYNNINSLTFEKNLLKAKVVNKIVSKVIDFLAQIEDFQKRLWEKKKFIVKTNYVITLDKIAEYSNDNFVEIEIVPEILKCEKQINEWKTLFKIDIKNKEDLVFSQMKLGGSEWKKLPIDTRYFTDNFKWKLVDALTQVHNLNDLLNGILIKSENWHALNLIQKSFAEKIKTIYIDPPFNLGKNADFLYKVNYKDSCWITLLENRLNMARDLLNEKGCIFVRCDYNGNMFVRLLLNSIFDEKNYRNEIHVKRIKKNVMDKDIQKLPEGLDTIYVFSKTDAFIYTKPFRQMSEKRKGFWRHMGDSAGSGSSKIFFGLELKPPEGKHWKYSQNNINKLINEGKLILECKKCKYKHDKTKGEWTKCPICNENNPQPKYWVEEKDEEVLDSNWSDISGFTFNWNFSTENSEVLLKRIIESTSKEGEFIMDFFLGSGTTTAVAHKLRRKWIGMEMGEHFYSVLLPRMKKVLAYDKSGISKEKSVKEYYNDENAGGFFKYHILEQYEDSLNNIQFSKRNDYQTTLDKFDDYFINYMLNFESKEISTGFTPSQILNPFNFKLRITKNNEIKTENIDLIETFNYLLGVEVEKIRLFDNLTKYIVIFGVHDNFETVIIWRNIENLDLRKDKEFIENVILKDLKPDRIYVNGNSFIKDAILIDEKMHKLMMGI